jgi:crotonobetainyl-CoA:carnitine CoA-transferase CaiB-like acyl-CoA transferase
VAPVFVPGMGMDFQTLVAFLEADELMDPKYNDSVAQALYADDLETVYRRKFAEKGRHEWFHSAQEWRLPFGLAQTTEDLAGSEQLAERAFWVEPEREYSGKVRMPGHFFRSTEPAYALRRPAPTLGEHNVDIWTGLVGYSLEELVVLRERDII